MRVIELSNWTHTLRSSDTEIKLFLYAEIVLATDKDQWMAEMMYIKTLMKKRDFRTLVRRPFVLQLSVSI